MRTYELHASFKQIKRADGRSSVAASAYRSASRQIDERTGEISDYTRKAGVERSALFAPEDAPEWALDRSQLWNAVEQKENRKNSMVARELEIGFPAEFNQQQRLEAGRAIALQLVKKHGVAVDVCWHTPGKDGDHRNHHAHILFTGRAIHAEGWEKKKYRDFNNDMIEVDGIKTTTGKQTVKEWRLDVADTFNQIARRDGLEVTTEHRSFEERGLERVPTIKLGFGASQMEKRGIRTERGNLNRRVKAFNLAVTERIKQTQLAKEIIRGKEKFRQKFAHYKKERALQHELELELQRSKERERLRQQEWEMARRRTRRRDRGLER